MKLSKLALTAIVALSIGTSAQASWGCKLKAGKVYAAGAAVVSLDKAKEKHFCLAYNKYFDYAVDYLNVCEAEETDGNLNMSKPSEDMIALGRELSRTVGSKCEKYKK